MTTDMYRLIQDLGAEVTVPEDGIVSRTIYQDDHVKALLFGFSPGQELSEHTAATSAIMHFVKGTARVTVGADKLSGQAGTWVHMTPNLAHSVYAETSVVMLLLLLKTAKAAPAGDKA